MARKSCKLAGSLQKERCWTSVHDRYQRDEVLGEGTYGVVFSAQNIETGQRVAMKRSRMDLYPEEGVPATALREVSLLRDFRNCPNVMQLHEISCNNSRLYMVCEFLDYDLKKYLKANNKKIPYKTVKSICKEVLKGLAWCHGNRVMHRDLKPHNILLDKDAKVVKLADFGLARAAHAPGKTLTHEVITLWYRPPELLLGGCNYTDSVDIWSMGCILAELLSGQPLFMGDCEIDTLFRIFRLLGTPDRKSWPSIVELPEGQSSSQWPTFSVEANPFSGLHPELDDAGMDLLAKLLRYDPETRISAMEALEHPWFNDNAMSETPVKYSKPLRVKAVARQSIGSISSTVSTNLSSEFQSAVKGFAFELEQGRPLKRLNHGH